MRITVFGGTGLIGSRVVPLLEDAGHSVVAASRRTGADVLTGEGLADALAGAEVLVDLTNSPSLEDGPALEFFTTSTTNLTAAAVAAKVGHYVALSIVGVDGMPESGYMRAKVTQESIVRESGVPYTVIRATQFHEFAEPITASLDAGDELHAPDARIQPIAGDEVAAEVAKITTSAPRNGHIDIGGPDKMSFADLARAVLDARGDSRPVVVTSEATYFGIPVNDNSLVTGEDAVIARVRFADWLANR
jgi:uncharacterized protein YbjT (DUF2867 family)